MKEKGIIVGSFANSTTIMAYIAAVNYGTNTFNDLYQDDDQSKTYISD